MSGGYGSVKSHNDDDTPNTVSNKNDSHDYDVTSRKCSSSTKLAAIVVDDTDMIISLSLCERLPYKPA